MVHTLTLVLFFACWGSFLNVVGYRLINDMSLLTPRSCCPSCNHLIYWHDNIPIISWLLLRGDCRFCKQPISMLYPAIEISSIIIFYLLYTLVPFSYFIGYFVFFSALIAVIRSDLEFLLISQYTTLFLIPVAFVFSWGGWLPITLGHSILGAVIGFGSLFSIGYCFTYCTGKKGLGEGDMDLLALIGAFTGVLGVWATVLIASVTGSIIGMWYILVCKTPPNTKIPFGPFLALGAIIFVLWQPYIINWLLPTL